MMRRTLLAMMGILLMLGLPGRVWREGVLEQLQALGEEGKRAQDLDRLMQAAWECEALAIMGQRTPLEDTDRLFWLGYRTGRAYYAHVYKVTDAKDENWWCAPEHGGKTIEFRLGEMHHAMWSRMNGFLSLELEKSWTGNTASLAEEERGIALRLFHSRNCALLAAGALP